MPGSTRVLLKLIEKMEMKPSQTAPWIVRDIVPLHFTPSDLGNSSDTVLENIAEVGKEIRNKRCCVPGLIGAESNCPVWLLA